MLANLNRFRRGACSIDVFVSVRVCCNAQWCRLVSLCVASRHFATLHIGKLREFSEFVPSYRDVAHSSLKSDLPTEIGALSGLTYLSLAENALTGTVPEQLAQLTALDSLYACFLFCCDDYHDRFLHGNKFVGVVPHIRANLTTCKFVLASLPGARAIFVVVSINLTVVHVGNCFNISLTPDCTQLAGSCVCEEEGIKCHHDVCC